MSGKKRSSQVRRTTDQQRTSSSSLVDVTTTDTNRETNASETANATMVGNDDKSTGSQGSAMQQQEQQHAQQLGLASSTNQLGEDGSQSGLNLARSEPGDPAVGKPKAVTDTKTSRPDNLLEIHDASLVSDRTRQPQSSSALTTLQPSAESVAVASSTGAGQQQQQQRHQHQQDHNPSRGPLPLLATTPSSLALTGSTPSATSQRISATASSPTSSPSATPGLGARLGRRDLPTQSHHSSSTFSRFVGSSTDPAAKGNGHRHGPTHALSEDELAHLRPKPHPHTTPSGPRGIEKAQKQRVLQAIRPDPRNLPEELLKANAHLYPSPLIIGEGEDRTPSTSGSASGSGVGQGTEGGAGSTTNGPPGDGLGLGIGLGGKAHPNLSRWVHRQPKNALGAGQMSRRQRRLPSTGREVDARVIHSSVFTPVLTSIMDGQPVTQAPALTPDHTDPMTSERYVALVESVKDAIRNDIQPLRIAQGSSGSYFCRNMQGKIVGVFKPKNEEPYGQLNPKWAKWIHRNLFPCCFGRSCLIPNLGYISEAATSLVDKRLQLNIVPSTEVVWLSSPAFHYDYLDRRAYRNHGKALPDKVGSFQLFLNGFKDANLFMRDHPWPNESHSSLSSYGATGTTARRRTSDSSSSTSTGEQDEGSSENGSITGSTRGERGGATASVPKVASFHDKQGFCWTPALQQQFREQFEKLIILDYLIRNTDRGLDNWMIRYCEKEGISVVAGPPSSGQRPIPQSQQRLQSDSRRNSRIGDLLGLNSDRQSLRSTTSSLRESVPRGGMLATPPGTPPRSSLARPATLPSASGTDHSLEDEANETTRLNPGQRPRVPSPTQPHTSESERIAHATGAARSEDEGTIPLTETEAHFGANHVHVAAIDNGLAFPFKHPDSWRSYPYGWLFLPRALISQPFTKATRDHFLPLLSSPIWWRETIADLRRLFSIDSDFDQGMFDKQMAVMKGQGWNIVETLKNPEQGPMDLCRRVALVIWDEEHILESSAVAKAILTARQPRMPINTPALHVGDGHIQDGASVPAGSLKTIAGMHPFVSAYANTPPKAKMMDASTAAMNYGMSPMTSSSVGVGKTVSASSTAVGDIAHLGRDSGIAMSNSLAYDLAQSLRSGSLKSGSLVPSSSLTKIPPSILVTGGSDGHELDSTLSKGAPLRQVVSDGEYDLDDDYDPDDYSSDEDYDEDPYEEDEDDVFFVQSADEDDATVQHRRSVSLPSAATAAAATRAKKGFVLSIDKALSEMDHAEGNAAEETLGTRRRRRSAEWSRGERHRRRQSHQSEGGRGEEGPSNGQTAAAAKGHHGHGPDGASSHRRSRTEQDDKIGSIRFESNSTGRGGGGGRSGETIIQMSPEAEVDEDADDTVPLLRKKPVNEEVERGRSFFARGLNFYGGESDEEEEEERSKGGRPKWADRLRRGLSFDGHLGGIGIGQAARRERRLRKQRQRERELRERRVVVVERIEPVTTNLPYFSWW